MKSKIYTLVMLILISTIGLISYERSIYDTVLVKYKVTDKYQSLSKYDTNYYVCLYNKDLGVNCNIEKNYHDWKRLKEGTQVIYEEDELEMIKGSKYVFFTGLITIVFTIVFIIMFCVGIINLIDNYNQIKRRK